jgi:PPOX class probable F420-dependent enzyme
MTRRAAIQLTTEEQQRFLEGTKTIILSTLDPRGYPHSVPMWFVMDAGCCLMTTYARSQKVQNIRRDPRVALLAECGESYETLKGLLIRGRAQVVADVEACLDVLSRVHRKMLGAMPPGIEEALKLQARKRVVITVRPERVSSWDHRKLGGTY